MSCKETEGLIADYLGSGLSDAQRCALDQHMVTCGHCRHELAAAQHVTAHLRGWHDQTVPQWIRTPGTLRGPQHARPSFWIAWWRWAPMALSLVLVLTVFSQAQLTRTADGFVLAFGGNSAANQQSIEDQLARYQEQQRLLQEQEFEVLATRMEERQDASNIRLMETVISQMSDSTARSLDQVMTYFEVQRQQDMEILQSTYEQLADSDYQTIRSVEQLASFVQYQP